MGPSFLSEQKHFTKKGDRVRLKGDGSDALYPAAYAYSEGWVDDQKIDSLGYPLIYVKWDKDHWTFNGEEDNWFYESHYDVVEGERQVTDDKRIDLSEEELIAKFKEFLSGGATTPPEPEAKTDDARFNNLVKHATEVLGKAKGFALFTITDIPDSETGQIETTPQIFYAHSLVDPDPSAKILMDLHISHMAAQLHRELGTDTIREINEVDE